MNYHNFISKRLQPLLDGVLRDYTSQASDMYKQAQDNTKSKYTSRIALNAQSYDRHWTANERLYELALNYDDIVVDILSNKKNSFYTVIQQDNVVVTISQVSSPGEMVRNSKFRNNFAYRYGANRSLFDDQTFSVPSLDDTIYAVILHGPISQKDANIGFLNIATIDANFSEYSYNESLFELCSIKHPFKLSEAPVTPLDNGNAVTIKLKSGIDPR
ncbi:MAG: hypothetical protein ABJI69_11075 [Balneola sp.]